MLCGKVVLNEFCIWSSRWSQNHLKEQPQDLLVPAHAVVKGSKCESRNMGSRAICSFAQDVQVVCKLFNNRERVSDCVEDHVMACMVGAL